MKHNEHVFEDYFQQKYYEHLFKSHLNQLIHFFQRVLLSLYIFTIIITYGGLLKNILDKLRTIKKIVFSVHIVGPQNVHLFQIFWSNLFLNNWTWKLTKKEKYHLMQLLCTKYFIFIFKICFLFIEIKRKYLKYKLKFLKKWEKSVIGGESFLYREVFLNTNNKLS